MIKGIDIDARLRSLMPSGTPAYICTVLHAYFRELHIIFAVYTMYTQGGGIL